MRLVWGDRRRRRRATRDGRPAARGRARRRHARARRVNYPRARRARAPPATACCSTPPRSTSALGTGGLHFVVARAGGGEGVQLDDPSGGHIMKLRYTPLQRDVLAVESPESPHHARHGRRRRRSRACRSCAAGCTARSPLVAAAIKDGRPDAAGRVLHDRRGRAAARALRHRPGECRDAGLLDATVTCGQAFGGELEAVNLHSGLLAARHVVARRRRDRRDRPGRRGYGDAVRARRHRAGRGDQRRRRARRDARSRACASRSPTRASATAA